MSHADQNPYVGAASEAELIEDAGSPRPDTLPLTAFQVSIEKAVKRLKGRPRHCGRNAIHGLRQAWRLTVIDPEMAGFRAITAEEEAATGLIVALKQRHYPHSDRLNPWNHKHKSALTPFLQAVAKVFVSAGFPNPTLHLQPASDPPRVDIYFRAQDFGISAAADDMIGPSEPLHAVISEGTAGTDDHRTMMFKEELQELADAAHAANIDHLVNQEANLRNQLLYADNSGYPLAVVPDEFIKERLRRVSVLLILTIAVLQTSELQLLAVQVVESLARVLTRFEGPSYEYGGYTVPADFRIEVRRSADGEMKARIQRPSNLRLDVGALNFSFHSDSSAPRSGFITISASEHPAD